jgi:hypothetical protein
MQRYIIVHLRLDNEHNKYNEVDLYQTNNKDVAETLVEALEILTPIDGGYHDSAYIIDTHNPIQNKIIILNQIESAEKQIQDLIRLFNEPCCCGKDPYDCDNCKSRYKIYKLGMLRQATGVV